MQIICETVGNWGGDSAAINEIEFFENNIQINFSTTKDDIYGGDIQYWDYSSWGRQYLSDKNKTYSAGTSTLVPCTHRSPMSQSLWGRFLINLESDSIDDLRISIGGGDKRTPKEVRFYKVLGTYDKATHLDARSNDGLILIGEIITTQDEIAPKDFTIKVIKTLIKNGADILTFQNNSWVNTNLVEPVSKENYNLWGMFSIGHIPTEKWQELNDEFEVLSHCENSDELILEIETDPFRPIDLLREMGGEVSIVAWTDSDEPLTLTTKYVAKSKIEYLLSPDNIKWYGYNGTEWIENLKMSKTLLESLTSVEFKKLFGLSIYKSSLYIKAFMSNEIPEETTLLKEITVEFTPNAAPLIMEPSVAPDEIHAEFATVTGTLKDLEGDEIEYRVLIKKANASDFAEVDKWTKVANDFHFMRAYNYPYFEVGINQLKIEARDQRGAISEWICNITVVNIGPTLVYTFNDFNIKGTINDSEGDDVTYRVLINDVPKMEFLPLAPSPRNINFTWDSIDLNFGVMNKITIEIKDSFGTVSKEEFKVMGSYKGLLFKNEKGEYYSDDRDNMLQWLNFGTIVGGQTTAVKKVILENRNGFHIQDISLQMNDVVNKLNPEDGQQQIKIPFIEAEMSETEMPFTASKLLEIADIMQHGDTKEIYLRIKTDKYARSGGEFKVNSKAEPVI